MRRQFTLPEEDILFLDNLGLEWETIIDRGMHWVIVHDYPVPLKYDCSSVSVAVKIETGYPRLGLDMAYFFPHLKRSDGKGIRAVCNMTIDGKQYQRWSRHRTAANPWRAGVDDLSTHFSLINFWFEQEFIKQPYGLPA
ncbi:hypothetical protein D1164_04570 [Mariniphaga sediminis]|uniref:Uncharacterized protein n=1 Tax=Mariniphaga sediminis TaxID=1628158 RepID=A0A399D739_9BACT|nr:E2/UBC family protein [Mariniphaga sediminis]RIH66190.1 hypothetical protein D1164_04570 [Mariniphaga sediminis]